MNKIDKIVKSGLCLGCGLCETIATKEKCEMQLNSQGFYKPVFKKALAKIEINQILRSCPGIHVESEKNSKVWGNLKKIVESWSTDPKIRHKGSSGGVITSLSVYLLESQKVDGILHVGVMNDSCLYNHLKVSRTKEEVIQNAASRYAPALVFNKIREILDKSLEVYAFIGKPCDIAGLKNFLKEFPQYKERIKYYISLFCAGIPSYNGTKKIIELAGYNDEPKYIKYRGEGWPGYFEAKFENKPALKISYNDSWGKVLSKHLGIRCKICPDGIGLLADIVVGDSWDTKDGYPDFEESDGRSFVMIRNNNGQKLFNDALENQDVISNNIDVSRIAEMQKYQYQRRLNSGYRILPVQLFTGFLLNFKGLGIKKMMLKANVKRGIKNMLGTSKRLIKIIKLWIL